MADLRAKESGPLVLGQTEARRAEKNCFGGWAAPVISGCGFMDPQLLEEIAHRHKNVLCEYLHATCTFKHRI